MTTTKNLDRNRRIRVVADVGAADDLFLENRLGDLQRDNGRSQEAYRLDDGLRRPAIQATDECEPTHAAAIVTSISAERQRVPPSAHGRIKDTIKGFHWRISLCEYPKKSGGREWESNPPGSD